MPNSTKLKRLKAAGWKIGTTKDFLGLSDQEAALVEVKLSLIETLKKSRQKSRLSQTDLAQRMGSSQSRVAKIEAGDASVSLDLIVRALIAAGTTQQDIRKAFTLRVPFASMAR
jgi:ribosome-binding protein aMBF1 (putative translation factor)